MEQPPDPVRPLDPTDVLRPVDRPEEPGPGWTPRAREPDHAFPAPFRWWDALLIFVVVFVVGGVALVPLIVLDVLADETTLIAASAVISGVALTGVTLGYVAVVRRGGGLRALMGPVRPRLLDVAIGLGHGVLAFFVVNVALVQGLAFVAERTGRELPSAQDELRLALAEPRLLPLIGFAVIVLAPLGEELLYRGVLFQALRRVMPVWPAIGLSGLLFALSHVEPFAVALLFPVGMYLAWIFYRRGSMVVAVVAHLAFNALGAAAAQLPMLQ